MWPLLMSTEKGQEISWFQHNLYFICVCVCILGCKQQKCTVFNLKRRKIYVKVIRESCTWEEGWRRGLCGVQGHRATVSLQGQPLWACPLALPAVALLHSTAWISEATVSNFNWTLAWMLLPQDENCLGGCCLLTTFKACGHVLAAGRVMNSKTFSSW